MGLEKALIATGIRLRKPINPYQFHLAWHCHLTETSAANRATDLLKNFGQIVVEDIDGYRNIGFDLWQYHRVKGWSLEVCNLIKSEPGYKDAKRRGQFLARLLPAVDENLGTQDGQLEGDAVRALLQMIHFPSLYREGSKSICDFYWQMTVDQPLTTANSVFLAQLKVLSEEFGR